MDKCPSCGAGLVDKTGRPLKSPQHHKSCKRELKPLEQLPEWEPQGLFGGVQSELPGYIAVKCPRADCRATSIIHKKKWFKREQTARSCTYCFKVARLPQ